MNGTKYDDGKARWDLVPWRSLIEIVKVLTHGAEKYDPNNWMHVPNARDRYFAASQRHLIAWQQGETTDPDSGLPHLAHAGCCILFLQWFDLKLAEPKTPSDKPVVNAHMIPPLQKDARKPLPT